MENVFTERTVNDSSEATRVERTSKVGSVFPKLPLPLNGIQGHQWHLPSAGVEGPDIAKGQELLVPHPGSASGVGSRPTNNVTQHNLECEAIRYENHSVTCCARKDNHTPLLSAEGLQRFIICYVAYAFLYFTRKPLSVVKEEIRMELGVSTFVLGLMDTAFLGCYAVGQLLMPICVAKISGQRLNLLIVCSFMGSFVAAFAFGCSSSSVWFVAVWGLNGLMHSPVFPIFIKVLSPEVSPKARGSVMGLWTTSQQLG